ncbi:MAG: hypothetical protein JO266_22440 [Acidobacteria bacterium]|nr:hypothetical protein [Acidobacteriota bacterium]
MKAKMIRCLLLLLCCAPLSAQSANVTYFLNLPWVLGYEAWGTVTTDGAAAPTAADIVDWNVTLWSSSNELSFVLTPATGTLAQFQGVTATPAALYLGTDPSDAVTWNSNQTACTYDQVFCYAVHLGLFTEIPDHEWAALYTVSGFHAGYSGVVGPLAEPIATLIPRTEPPRTFVILGHIVIGLQTTPTLLQKVSAAHRYYNAGDVVNTCDQLSQLINQVQAIGAAGAASKNLVTQIVGYANSIRMQIACAGCGG